MKLADKQHFPKCNIFARMNKEALHFYSVPNLSPAWNSSRCPTWHVFNYERSWQGHHLAGNILRRGSVMWPDHLHWHGLKWAKEKNLLPHLTVYYWSDTQWSKSFINALNWAFASNQNYILWLSLQILSAARLVYYSELDIYSFLWHSKRRRWDLDAPNPMLVCNLSKAEVPHIKLMADCLQLSGFAISRQVRRRDARMWKYKSRSAFRCASD